MSDDPDNDNHVIRPEDMALAEFLAACCDLTVDELLRSVADGSGFDYSGEALQYQMALLVQRSEKMLRDAMSMKTVPGPSFVELVQKYAWSLTVMADIAKSMGDEGREFLIGLASQAEKFLETMDAFQSNNQTAGGV